MKALISVAALLCLAAPTTASASCYFIYSAQNQLLYRSTLAPIDLSRPISEGMKGRFAGGHLTMIPDETGCPELLVNGEAQIFASLGFTSPNRPTTAIEASPLFRNADSRNSGTMTDQGDSSTSGNDAAARPSARKVVTPQAAPRGR